MVYRELTVAGLREREDSDHVEVLFLESARIYRLFAADPEAAGLLERLHEAEGAGQPVEVGLASLESDVIEDVR